MKENVSGCFFLNTVYVNNENSLRKFKLVYYSLRN